MMIPNGIVIKESTFKFVSLTTGISRMISEYRVSSSYSTRALSSVSNGSRTKSSGIPYKFIKESISSQFGSTTFIQEAD